MSLAPSSPSSPVLPLLPTSSSIHSLYLFFCFFRLSFSFSFSFLLFPLPFSLLPHHHSLHNNESRIEIPPFSPAGPSPLDGIPTGPTHSLDHGRNTERPALVPCAVDCFRRLLSSLIVVHRSAVPQTVARQSPWRLQGGHGNVRKSF